MVLGNAPFAPATPPVHPPPPHAAADCLPPRPAQAEAELNRLEQVYALYAEHSGYLCRYGGMLWVDVDVAQLIDNVAATGAKLKRLAPAAAGLPAYSMLAAELQAFADSLPLMQDLKNDSLRCGTGKPLISQRHHAACCTFEAPRCARRPRHWHELMALTGQELDLDPKTCTLDTIFGMQLHRFAADIRGVVSGAVKELTIEAELRKLAEAWREQRGPGILPATASAWIPTRRLEGFHLATHAPYQ